MTNLNVLVIEGCITKAAELKKTANGKSFCVFTLVVNRDHKSGENWEEHASFFNISLWGTKAEKTSQYLKKGMRVAIEGYLEQSRWADTDGTNKSRIDIRVVNLRFLSKIIKTDQQKTQGALDEATQNEFEDYDYSDDSYDGDIF